MVLTHVYESNLALMLPRAKMDNTGFTVKRYRRGVAVKRKQLSFVSLLLFIALAPLTEAQEGGFRCEEHNLFINRLGALPSAPPLPDIPETKILSTQTFSDFSKYGIDSITLMIRFDPDSDTDSEGRPKPTGSLRIAATIRAHEKTSEQEIRANREREAWEPKLHDEYSKVGILLRGRLIPASDPSFRDSERPNIRLEQPETGIPIFLVKFIGDAPAGGWGDVDSDNAMVLDLRGGTLSVPAALGCMKDDFAGQGPGGGWADCRWDHVHQDYKCKSSKGKFFLISGKQIVGHTNSKRRK